MNAAIPIELLINTPSGNLPLTRERYHIPLPRGPEAVGPVLLYGPYLEAVAGFLKKDSFAPLLEAVGAQAGRAVSSQELRSLRIISIKHGAFYNVVLLRVRLSDGAAALALNIVSDPSLQQSLTGEFSLLRELHARFGLPFLPRPYTDGTILYGADEGSGQIPLRFFIAEWFEGFHEFHLTRVGMDGSLALKVWDLERGDTLLGIRDAYLLYRRAAFILTSYFDELSFRQIYPWHHAAGDFIVRPAGESTEVRLITARGYRCLLSEDCTQDDILLAAVHFFINMSLRMRLDRLDGTGELAWAGPECLDAVVDGFLQAFQSKIEKGASIPRGGDALEVLRHFTREEWMSLTELILEQGLVEVDELEFLNSHLEEHVSSLRQVLKEKFK